MSFDSLHLMEPILRALKTEGYIKPTPIQAKAIPLALQHKDILGVAQTGTGKTAAFAIPILQLLSQEKHAGSGKRAIRSLILTPTRELAIQIGESFATYGKHVDLKHKVIFGGVSQHGQVQALQAGIDILIATPGRLLDLMNQRHVHLNAIQFFVLDEADRMLDMGFINDVKKIIAKLPAKRHSMFFSATMPPPIVQLAGSILVNPATVAVTPVSSTVDIINQVVYFVDKGSKKDLLVEVLKDAAIDRALVFTRTKHGADKVVKDLTRNGIHAQAIHGNKSQNARQHALKNFKSKVTRVLVATDIAARGIDIDDLSHVINYELPNIPESYVHRIGRTGRAGASGNAIAFCDAEEKAYLKDIQKLIGKQIPVMETPPLLAKNRPAAKPASRPLEHRQPQQRRRPQSHPERRDHPSTGEKKEHTGERSERKIHHAEHRRRRPHPVDRRDQRTHSTERGERRHHPAERKESPKKSESQSFTSKLKSWFSKK